jgi:hypothetical protein
MFNFFKKKSNTDFKFTEPENTACIVCDHVLNRHRPILYASHDSDDGSWQFLCGQDDHTPSNAKVISLKNATMIDPSINDLYEMPLGVGAERENIHAQWIPFRKA